MKQIYFLFIFLAFAVTAQAQNVIVTLRVDMTNETVSADGVTVAGNFQAADSLKTGVADWTPGQHFLTDANNDNIYELQVAIPAGTYEYKYINGIAWGADETDITDTCGAGGLGSLNRQMVVDASNNEFGFVFNTCTPIMSTSATNIKEAIKSKVAPNPMSGNSTSLFVDATKLGVFDMAIVNTMGQVVRTQTGLSQDVVNIERGDLTAGIYFIRLEGENGSVIERLVIQ